MKKKITKNKNKNKNKTKNKNKNKNNLTKIKILKIYNSINKNNINWNNL